MSSLTKFGVPIGNKERQMMKQPKRKDHWRATFLGFGDNSEPISLDANSISEPSVSYDPHEVHSYNSKMYYKGKYTWSTIELSVRDTIDNGPLNAILMQWRKEFDHFKQEARAAAGQYKFSLFIEKLDGSNSDDATAGVINGWICEGCLLMDIAFGDGLDYSSSEYSNITITIQPDNCLPMNADKTEMDQETRTFVEGVLNEVRGKTGLA